MVFAINDNLFFLIEILVLMIAIAGHEIPLLGIINYLPAIGIIAVGAIGMVDTPSQLWAVTVVLIAVVLPLFGYARKMRL